MLQSSPNLPVKLCIEIEHLPAWRNTVVNVRPCCLFLAVSVQEQQWSQGADHGPQDHIVLYTNFSWLQIDEGLFYTHLTRCLAAK